MQVKCAIEILEKAGDYVRAHPDSQIGPGARSPYGERSDALWATVAGIEDLLDDLAGLALETEIGSGDTP